MKATENELELHNSIKEKDDLALSQLFELKGEEIILSLTRWYPRVAAKDKALITEAVNEAFWGYYKNPYSFDPKLYTLQRFLEIAADRDLKNILIREKKHSNKKDMP